MRKKVHVRVEESVYVRGSKSVYLRVLKGVLNLILLGQRESLGKSLGPSQRVYM